MADWILSLTFSDKGVLTAVTSPLGTGSPADPVDRKTLKKSHYGLRALHTLYEHDSKYEPITTETVRKCYMIIGGFKVEVPCPPP